MMGTEDLRGVVEKVVAFHIRHKVVLRLTTEGDATSPYFRELSKKG